MGGENGTDVKERVRRNGEIEVRQFRSQRRGLREPEFLTPWASEVIKASEQAGTDETQVKIARAKQMGLAVLRPRDLGFSKPQDFNELVSTFTQTIRVDGRRLTLCSPRMAISILEQHTDLCDLDTVIGMECVGIGRSQDKYFLFLTRGNKGQSKPVGTNPIQ